MTESEVAAFLRRELNSARLLECADHIAECEICREKLASRQDLAAAKSQVERDLNSFVKHIPEDELQKYVSGRLDLARIREIDGHLTKCIECGEEVRDLRNFIAELPSPHRSFLPRWYVVAAAAAMVLVIVFVSLRRPPELVALNDVTGRVSLDARGNLHGIQLLTTDQRRVIRQALTEQRLSLPASWSELRGEPGALMGTVEQTPFHLESPLGTAVRSTRPIVSWTSDRQSTGYRVTLKDENTGQTITTDLLEATSWTVSPDLKRGHTYDWQIVSTRKNGTEVLVPQPPTPPAKFIVIDAATNSKLEQLPPSHLLRAVLYVNAGLLDDAIHEVMELQKLNPQSQLVRNFLDQLRQARANQS